MYSLKILALSISFMALSMKVADEPWNTSQLMEPQQLASLINDSDPANDPMIFNVGPAGFIKGSTAIGPASEKKGIKTLKEKLKKVPKDKSIVVYCGCCPFKDCPNIRPAFSLLNSQGFTNHKLLDLPKNLKVNWIDKGFPMEKKN